MATIHVFSDEESITLRGAAQVLSRHGHRVVCNPSSPLGRAQPPDAVVVSDPALLPPTPGARGMQRRGPVILVVEALSEGDLRTAIRAGITSVVLASASAATLELTLAASVAGLSVVPRGYVLALASRLAEPPGRLRQDERVMLRVLAISSSAAAADELGYSERQVQRIGAQLRESLGLDSARSLTIMAARWGLLEPDASDP